MDYISRCICVLSVMILKEKGFKYKNGEIRYVLVIDKIHPVIFTKCVVNLENKHKL